MCDAATVPIKKKLPDLNLSLGSSGPLPTLLLFLDHSLKIMF